MALLFAVSARAQEVTKDDLIAELLDLIDIKAFTEKTLEAPPDADDAEKLFRKRLANRLTRERLFDMYASEIDRAFSEVELRELIAFYKTTAGEKSARWLAELVSADTRRSLLNGDEAHEVTKELEREARDPVVITMNAIYAIANGVEAYATDHNEYPIVDINTLRPMVIPVYVLDVPMTDGWGMPFVYVGNGTNYRIVSGGADRRIDSQSRVLTKNVAPVLNAPPDADIIFQDGVFIQAPVPRKQRRE